MSAPVDYSEYAEMRLGQELADVQLALARLREYCMQRGMQETLWRQLELATAEALNNAVRHGCRGRPDATVLMRWCWSDAIVSIEIIDPGDYLPRNRPAALPEDLLAEGGRGAFLIAQMTDLVEHRLLPEGHCIRLEKTVGAAVPIAVTEMEATLDAMMEEVTRCYEIISALFRFSGEMATASTFSDFLQRTLERLLLLVPGEGAVARFFNPARTALVRLGAAPEAAAAAWPESLPVEVPTVEVLAATRGKTTTADSGAALAAADPVRPWPHGVYACPIACQADLLGSLLVTHRPGATYFSAEEMNLIRYVADFIGSVRTNHLLNEERQEERLALRELEIAARLQQALLPKAWPALDGYVTQGFCLSARHVGGDYCDVIPVGGDGLLLVIADVMGKGISAAFLATVFRSAVHARLEFAARPGYLLQEVNRQMSKDLAQLDMFITAQIGFLSAREHRCVLANAGHCPLLHFRRDRAELARHHGDGIPLGIDPDAEYRAEAFDIGAGDSLFLITDGLYEVEQAGAMMGLDTFAAELARICRGGDPDTPGAVFRYVNGYGSDPAGDDDRTLLLVRRDA